MNPTRLGDLALTIALLIVLIAAAGLLIFFIRRRYRRGSREAGAGDAVFSLERVTDLRQSGDLTEEEYAVMRNAALADLPAQRGFGLQDLRELKERGRISESEYEFVRALLLDTLGSV